MNRHSLAAAAAFTILLPGLANAGAALTPLDITGTWAASAKCSYRNGATKTSLSVGLGEVRILSHASGVAAMEIDGVGPLPRGAGSDGLCGFATGADGKGIAVFNIANASGNIVYDSNFPVGALYFKSIKIDADSAKMSGNGPTLIYVSPIGSCKIKLERTSSDPPVMNNATLIDDCVGI